MSQQNIRQYERDAYSKNPFAKPPKHDRDQQKDKGVPGSSWSLEQIEWLGVKWERECDISEMFSRHSELQPNCVLRRYIVDSLNKPWEEIENGKDLNQTTFYARLSSLARKKESIGEYDRSSIIHESGSQSPPHAPGPLSPFSPRQGQEPGILTQHIRSSPPLMPTTLTPPPRRQVQPPFSSPLSSPPPSIPSPTPRSRPQYLIPNSARQPESHDQEKLRVEETFDDEELTETGELAQHQGHGDDDFQARRGSGSVLGLPQLPPRNDPSEQLDGDAQETTNGPPYSATSSPRPADRRSTLRHPKKLINYAPGAASSDAKYDLRSRASSTYQPSSPQAPPATPPGKAHNIRKAQLDEEHKAESEVQPVARGFLYELGNIFFRRQQDIDHGSGVEWGLDVVQGSGKTDEFVIDAYRIEANADVDLTVVAQDKSTTKPRHRQVRLLIECKPAKHGLTRYDIFGQEVAEMLAEAMRLRAYHHRNRYTVFLVSWHHLDCYFSRMDVTDAYLAQLKDTSDLTEDERPHVRQSKKLSLKVDSERVEFGEICARMVIDMLAVYKQPRKLGIIRTFTA